MTFIASVDIIGPMNTPLEKPEKLFTASLLKTTEGSKALSDILGGKGAHLAEMTSMGLPVPPGFTITSSMSLYFLQKRQ